MKNETESMGSQGWSKTQDLKYDNIIRNLVLSGSVVQILPHASSRFCCVGYTLGFKTMSEFSSPYYSLNVDSKMCYHIPPHNLNSQKSTTSHFGEFGLKNPNIWFNSRTKPSEVCT